jgi:hypothetical protein
MVAPSTDLLEIPNQKEVKNLFIILYIILFFNEQVKKTGRASNFSSDPQKCGLRMCAIFWKLWALRKKGLRVAIIVFETPKVEL